MNASRRDFLALSAVTAGLGLAACARPGGRTGDQATDQQQEQPSVDLEEFEGLALKDDAWKYDAANDCYYQLGVKYCLKPGSEPYESLAIFVPGAYFDAQKSGESYKCTVKQDATLAGLTPKTAPVVMPVNSARLNAQACPTSYSYDGLSRYLSAGMVYVYAGFRGRSAGIASDSQDLYPGGAPWPVVDLKAAVRYLRYNASKLPANLDRVFVAGYGAGGGVSAVLGAGGDSALYQKYLEAIGAVTHDHEGNAVSDAICGSASWCPVTSFDTADGAYEWMMGQFSTTGTRKEGSWTAQLSHDLADSYGDYVNQLGLTDGEGNALGLEETSDGSYLAGEYYDQLLGCIEDGASSFLSSTEFPYTYTPARMSDSCFPGDPNLAASGADEIDALSSAGSTSTTSGAGTSGTGGDGTGAESSSAGSASTTTSATGVSQVQSTVYESLGSYLSALNSDSRWITYSSSRQTARITELWDFVAKCRPAQKEVCAFDALDRSTMANQLFGIDAESTLHFDRTVSDLLANNQVSYATFEGWDGSYVSSWSADVVKKDALGVSMADRVQSMNPLYHICGSYEGFGQAKVAPHWRINTGLFQTESALCGELNLARALSAYDGVRDVAFTPVWGRGYELAEASGDPQDRLVAWVLSCLESEAAAVQAS